MDTSDIPVRQALCVIAVHGLHGTDQDWKYFEQSLEEHFPVFARQHPLMSHDLMFCKLSKVNSLFKTQQGLETMGQRLCTEVHQFFKSEVIPHLEEAAPVSTRWRIHLCVVGHSLGGLIARMAMRHLLCDDSPMSLHALREDLEVIVDDSQQHGGGRFMICPSSYISISTPHLGSRRPKSQDPWETIISHGFLFYCSNAAGKTGKELVLIDAKDCIEESLLMEMSNPAGSYMKALNMFPSKTLIGHLQDFTVPAASALICPDHQQRKGSKEQVFSVVAAAGFSPFQERRRTSSNSGDELQMSCRELSLTDDEGDTVAAVNPAADAVDSNTLYDKHVFCEAIPSASPLLSRHRRSVTADAIPREAMEATSWKHGVDLEYSAQMLAHLNTVKWRRILFDYNFNSVWRVTIHAIVIGKDMPLVPQSLKLLGHRSADFIVKLAMVDYLKNRK